MFKIHSLELSEQPLEVLGLYSDAGILYCYDKLEFSAVFGPYGLCAADLQLYCSGLCILNSVV